MKKELIEILNHKLKHLSEINDKLIELNGKIEESNNKIESMNESINIFKDEGNGFNIYNLVKIDRETFNKLLLELDDSVLNIFGTNTCNYDGLIYLINGINNGISLLLTQEQMDAINTLIDKMLEKENEYTEEKNKYQEQKSGLEYQDENVLEELKVRFSTLVDDLENERYLKDIDYLVNAIEFSEIEGSKVFDLLKYILQYNTDVYDKEKVEIEKQIEKELKRKEKEEKERIEREQEEERKRLEEEEKKRKEKERLEKEKAEKEEQERLEREQKEKEEQERLEREQKEKEEQERLEREQAEKEEQERLEKEQAEQEQKEEEPVEEEVPEEEVPEEEIPEEEVPVEEEPVEEENTEEEIDDDFKDLGLNSKDFEKYNPLFPSFDMPGSKKERVEENDLDKTPVVDDYKEDDDEEVVEEAPTEEDTEEVTEEVKEETNEMVNDLEIPMNEPDTEEVLEEPVEEEKPLTDLPEALTEETDEVSVDYATTNDLGINIPVENQVVIPEEVNPVDVPTEDAKVEEVVEPAVETPVVIPDIPTEEPKETPIANLEWEEVNKLLKDRGIKTECSDEIKNLLLSGDLENYRNVLDKLKSIDVLKIYNDNIDALAYILVYSDVNKINEVLAIVENSLSTNDSEDKKITTNIVFKTIPSIFVDNENGNYNNFIENVKSFKEYGIDLINLFDFSKEIFTCDHELIVNNYNIVRNYDLTINDKNAKYLLMLNNVNEKIDLFVESYYKDSLKNEIFDGIDLIKFFPVKLNIVEPLTIKRLRYSAENGKKIIGSKEKSITGEISNLSVDVLNIGDDYLNAFFDNKFDDISDSEVENYKSIINTNKIVDMNIDDTLSKLNDKINGIRYIIENHCVSKNKVVRYYNLLKENNIDTKKALLFSVCYNLIISKPEYDKIKAYLYSLV